MKRHTSVGIAEFPSFSGVGPARPALGRCRCDHGGDIHVLNFLGHRLACGKTVPGRKGPVRCPCNTFTPAGGGR